MKETIKLNKSGKKAIIVPFIWLLTQGIIYFVAAGSLNIQRAWLYFLSAIVITSSNSIYMWKVIPNLTNERGEFKPDTKSGDKILLSLFILIPIILIPIVTGFEVGRFKVNYVNPVISYVALCTYIVADIINLWAMSVNKYFEGTVRIQNDRNHMVITSGPYQFIRHPGYLAMLIGIIATPLILGSIFGLIPAFGEVCVIMLRTSYEDKILQRDLEGYIQYANDVRYRLIPCIW